jgi:hypothetical protein
MVMVIFEAFVFAFMRVLGFLQSLMVTLIFEVFVFAFMRVLSFLQSLMVMVIFEVFVFAFMKDISNGSPISCELFKGCYRCNF